MKKYFAFLLLCLFFLSPICLAQQIRPPVVSGQFYPASSKILAERIKQFLDWAEVKRKTDKDILALISPHAGYDYSGSTAAYAYKLISGASFSTVVVIGPSHFADFEGISVYPAGAWQTPLGNVDIDTELAEKLLQAHPQISFYEPAFSREHSLEVQIPFLQITLDNFKILPIAMGRFTYENCQILSQALLKITKDRKDILVIASTDMSHYHPDAMARGIDNQTIKELTNFDAKLLYSKLMTGENELCGAGPVVTTLLYAAAKGADEIEILKYANSGDITGDKERVVGYLSAVIYAPATATLAADDHRPPTGRNEMSREKASLLNEKQQRRLLDIARQTINEYVVHGTRLDFKEEDPLLLTHLGAFVTIHKQGKLRGCIGNIIGRQPLYLTVRDMAIEAAVADPRFSAVTPEELPEIDIEISVLSRPQPVRNVAEIEMGVHGVIVKKDFHSGVFLPQVATETGWSREEFLNNLCAHKAGLAASAWKDQDTELFSFTAQVFGEKDY